MTQHEYIAQKYTMFLQRDYLNMLLGTVGQTKNFRLLITLRLPDEKPPGRQYAPVQNVFGQSDMMQGPNALQIHHLGSLTKDCKSSSRYMSRGISKEESLD